MRKILLMSLILMGGLSTKAFCQAYNRVVIYQYDLDQWTVSETSLVATGTTEVAIKPAETNKTLILKSIIVSSDQNVYADVYFGTTWKFRIRVPANDTRGYSCVIPAGENTGISVKITNSNVANVNVEVFMTGTKK